jgi:hypothetical protein
MVNKKYNFLSSEQEEFLEKRKSKKQLQKEQTEYKKEKRLEFEEEHPLRTEIKKFVSREPKRTFGLRSLPSVQPAPALSKEQDMLQEMFSGNDNWGTGQNLPEINGALRTGGGIMNSGDNGQTGSMFGLKRNSFGFNGEGGY